MTKGGVIVKNRKMLLGTGIFLALGALLFMRSALAISFVPLKNGATGKDALTDIANSILNPWVTIGSIVGWCGIFFVVLGLIGTYRWEKMTPGEEK